MSFTKIVDGGVHVNRSQFDRNLLKTQYTQVTKERDEYKSRLNKHG